MALRTISLMHAHAVRGGLLGLMLAFRLRKFSCLGQKISDLIAQLFSELVWVKFPSLRMKLNFTGKISLFKFYGWI